MEMVERHGQVFAEIIHTILNDTSVVGKQQMQYVLLMASFAKHRRLVRTGYSPRALVYGHDENIFQWPKSFLSNT